MNMTTFKTCDFGFSFDKLLSIFFQTFMSLAIKLHILIPVSNRIFAFFWKISFQWIIEEAEQKVTMLGNLNEQIFCKFRKMTKIARHKDYTTRSCKFLKVPYCLIHCRCL